MFLSVPMRILSATRTIPYVIVFACLATASGAFIGADDSPGDTGPSNDPAGTSAGPSAGEPAGRDDQGAPDDESVQQDIVGQFGFIDIDRSVAQEQSLDCYGTSINRCETR